MESVTYTYTGVECSVWDDKGGIFLNTTTTQKELEYLFNKGFDNISRIPTEVSEKPKK